MPSKGIEAMVRMLVSGVTLSNLYMCYATGRLDESDALDKRYINAIVKCQAGKNRTDLICVSCD